MNQMGLKQVLSLISEHSVFYTLRVMWEFVICVCDADNADGGGGRYHRRHRRA